MEKSCVFCDRVQFEERLIMENSEWYVIATLGQITDGGYVLLVPKQHITCIGALDTEQAMSMRMMVRKVCRALSLEYQQSSASNPYPVTVFEHGMVGQTIQHAHIHFLPKVIDPSFVIRADFPGIKLEELPYPALLQVYYEKRKEPYFFWTVPEDTAIVCWNPPAPSQYLRMVTAKLLGRLERADWREMDPELDKRLWRETVARLKPYFTQK